MRFPAVALAPSRLYRSAHRRNWRSASELKPSTWGRSSRFPSAISVTSSPGVAPFVSLTMVVEPGGELVSWPRWSLLISSLRPMDRPVKTRGLVDDDDGGRTGRGGRRFTPAPGGFGGPAPPRLSISLIGTSASSHP